MNWSKLIRDHCREHKARRWDTPLGATNMCSYASTLFIKDRRPDLFVYYGGNYCWIENKIMLAHTLTAFWRPDGHTAILVGTDRILDFTLRQFFPDAPYPFFGPLSDYIAFCRERGASGGVIGDTGMSDALKGIMNRLDWVEARRITSYTDPTTEIHLGVCA